MRELIGCLLEELWSMMTSSNGNIFRVTTLIGIVLHLLTAFRIPNHTIERNAIMSVMDTVVKWRKDESETVLSAKVQ